MIPLTLSEIAEIVGGAVYDCPDPGVSVTAGVEFDSRAVRPGSLFLALPGERSDGHDFAATAIAAGAAGVLAARPVGMPAVVVEPTGRRESNAMALAADDAAGSGAAVLRALGALAREVTRRLSSGAALTVIGVTGSSGKTSTKDLLATVLAPAAAARGGGVVAPPGSFNNELGHPWTALRADASTRYLVLELSARGVGHVAELAAVVPPRVGVVLNVGHAHLGEFGSRAAIAQAKGELVEALPADTEGGLAVLNADDALVAAMRTRTAARVVTFGTAATADYRAAGVRADASGRASFTLHTPGGSAPVTLAVHGEHHVSNALAAAAVAGETAGMDAADIAAALGQAGPVSARRMAVHELADGSTLVDDSYNANPDSVRGALRTIAVMARHEDNVEPRRTWAILGEMAELGDGSVIEHDLVGRYIVRLNVSRLVVVGTGRNQHGLHQGAVMEGSWGEESRLVDNAAEAIAILDEEMRPGDIVLVKASQSVGLWSVSEHLLERKGTQK